MLPPGYLKRHCCSIGTASAWCLWSAGSTVRSSCRFLPGGRAESLHTAGTGCLRDLHRVPRITCTEGRLTLYNLVTWSGDPVYNPSFQGGWGRTAWAEKASETLSQNGNCGEGMGRAQWERIGLARATPLSPHYSGKINLNDCTSHSPGQTRKKSLLPKNSSESFKWAF